MEVWSYTLRLWIRSSTPSLILNPATTDIASQIRNYSFQPEHSFTKIIPGATSTKGKYHRPQDYTNQPSTRYLPPLFERYFQHFTREITIMTRAGYSKHHQLNKVISGGFVKSYSAHKINLVIRFDEKLRGAFALEKLLTFFGIK